MRTELLNEFDNQIARKKIKNTLKALGARRVNKKSIFDIFWDFSEARFQFSVYLITIDIDNFAGISISGEDGAVERFLEVFQALT